MCICVIYKCLSWDGDQQRDLGKPSHWWEAVRQFIPCGEWKEDSVWFEKRARMDSFAAVLPLPGYWSMCEVICVKEQIPCSQVTIMTVMKCVHVTDPFFFFNRRLKINHKIHLDKCFYSWERHHREHIGTTSLRWITSNTKYNKCKYFFLFWIQYVINSKSKVVVVKEAQLALENKVQPDAL